jgi:hypothetical protein
MLHNPLMCPSLLTVTFARTSTLRVIAGLKRHAASTACGLASAAFIHFHTPSAAHVAQCLMLHNSPLSPVLPTPMCWFLQGVEDMLQRLRVAWLVLPSVRQVLGMWCHSFNLPLMLLYVHFCSATSCRVSKICCGSCVLPG